MLEVGLGCHKNIIKTITRLEQYSDLHLAVSKTLPSSVIDTTLNLPTGDEMQYGSNIGILLLEIPSITTACGPVYH